MERRAREPTYTFITTRKREGGGEEKEGEKKHGRTEKERERERICMKIQKVSKSVSLSRVQWR